MNAKMKIMKRINAMRIIDPDLTHINVTQDEYDELGVDTLNGVKLVIRLPRTDDDKTDCFAWENGDRCYALTEKKCFNCSFYNNKINRKDIKRSIRNYEK